MKYRAKVKIARLIPIKRTSQDWQHLFPEIKILDPDGWNRHPDHFDEDWYRTKITYKEYEKRMIISTVQFDKKLF